jgi:1,4-dihydroxy-2-naphthoate octaprenyltransferase
MPPRDSTAMVRGGEKEVGWRRVRNVLRISYTIPFVTASAVGSAFALTVRPEWAMAVLVPLDVFFLAMFVNLSNDYFDHKSGADSKRFAKRDAEFEAGLKDVINQDFYWSGNAFDDGEITEQGGRRLLAVIATIAVLIAVPILLYAGWVVLLLGAIAFFLAYFYTAPPLNLGARGLGELDVFLSFAMMAYFSFYVIVPVLDWQMILIAVTVGFAVMLMRFVDQMSGYDAHVAAGEKDWCVRLGLERAVAATGVLLVLFYVLCCALIWQSLYFLLTLLTVPAAVKMMRALMARENRYRFIRSAPLMLQIAFAHMLLIIVALALRSAASGAWPAPSL